MSRSNLHFEKVMLAAALTVDLKGGRRDLERSAMKPWQPSLSQHTQNGSEGCKKMGGRVGFASLYVSTLYGHLVASVYQEKPLSGDFSPHSGRFQSGCN